MDAQQIAESAVSLDPVAVLKWIAALVFAIIGCSKAVSMFSGDRSRAAGANLEAAGKNAQIDIIEMLQRRMSDLEREQRDLRVELEEERNKRSEAEDMVDALTRRVSALEAINNALVRQIRALGQEPVGSDK